MKIFFFIILKCLKMLLDKSKSINLNFKNYNFF